MFGRTWGGLMNGRATTPDDDVFSVTVIWSTSSPVLNGGRQILMTNCVNNGNYCLAEPGRTYAVYLPHPGHDPVAIWVPTRLLVSAITGEKIDLLDVQGPS